MKPLTETIAESLAHDGWWSGPFIGASLHAYGHLRELGQDFARICEADPTYSTSKLKTYLHYTRPPYASDHPLMLLSPLIASFARAYLGPKAKQRACAIWVTQKPETEPTKLWSQRWHRDPDGPKLFKAFLHLEDCTIDNGPFEYIEGSQGNQRLELCPKCSYAKTVVEMPPNVVRTFTVPAGTLVIADTSGIHRGGRVISGQRIQAHWAYW